MWCGRQQKGCRTPSSAATKQLSSIRFLASPLINHCFIIRFPPQCKHQRSFMRPPCWYDYQSGMEEGGGSHREPAAGGHLVESNRGTKTLQLEASLFHFRKLSACRARHTKKKKNSSEMEQRQEWKFNGSGLSSSRGVSPVPNRLEGGEWSGY